MTWIRDEATVGAIDEQVSSLQHGLPQQNFVTEYQSLFQSVPPIDHHENRIGDIDDFAPPVGKRGFASCANANADALQHTPGDDTTDRTRIDKRRDLARAHLVFRQSTFIRKNGIDRVGQRDSDVYFTHGLARLFEEQLPGKRVSRVIRSDQSDAHPTLPSI